MPPTTQKDFDALETAMRDNNVEDLKEILQNFDIAATNVSGKTCLMSACSDSSSSPEVVKLLLDKINKVGGSALLEIQLTATNYFGQTCWGLACTCFSPEVMKLFFDKILEVGGPVLFQSQLTNKNKNGVTCLMLTSGNSKSPEVVKLLLDTIVEVGGPALLWSQLTATDNYGKTCLMFACSSSKSPEVVKVLLERIEVAGGPALQTRQLTATDNEGWTCLMLACGCSFSSPEVPKLVFEKIVEIGSNDFLRSQLTATTKSGYNCLVLASANSSSPDVLTLLAAALFELGLFENQYLKDYYLDDKKKKKLKEKANIDSASWTPDAASLAEVKAILHRGDAAARKKKADEEAAAKKKADEEAAAKKKAQEEVAEMKKAKVEAVAAMKKAEQETAVWKQKYFDLLESVNNKAEEEAIVKKKSSCFICNHIYSHTDQPPSDAEIAALIDNLTVDRSIVAGKLNKDNLIGQGGSAKVFRCSVESWPTQKRSEEQALPRCAEHSPEHIAFKVFNHVDDAAIKAELKTSLLGAAGCPQILAPLGLCRWETDDGEPKAAILLPCAEMSLAQVRPLDRANATLDDVTKTLDGLLSICKAVQHLHTKRNIIHRDIKPQNIFVLQAPSTDGGDEQAADKQRNTMQYKLGDLGASKQEQALSGSLTTKTGSVGTIAYMSPEQLLGQPATRASDIYSLGLTLFSSLSEDEAIPAKFFDNALIFLDAHNTGKIVIDPPTLPDCTLEYSSFSDLAITIGRCFESDPSKRPSADDLVRALTAAEATAKS